MCIFIDNIIILVFLKNKHKDQENLESLGKTEEKLLKSNN